MGKPDNTAYGQEASGSQQDSLEYQLDVLRIEIESIERISARLDEITQTNKNWAILTWGGSITIMLSNPELRDYLIFTAVFPALFWTIEAYWKTLQRRSGFRRMKIGEFLNDDRIVQSFEKRTLVDFSVLDPSSKNYRGTEEYKNYTSFKHTFWFPQVWVFYLTLIIISLILGVFFLLVM